MFSSVALLLCCAPASAREQPSPVVPDKDGLLRYLTDAKGNRVPDFSAAGYRGGGTPLPRVPARVTVAPSGGDDGARIQAALDYVAQLPLDSDNFRGAVELTRGRFQIKGALHLDASGVVLRGRGDDTDGTVLVAAGLDRRDLVQIRGRMDRTVATSHLITDDYVPVGSSTFAVAEAADYKVGDRVVIERPSPAEWIAEVGMDDAISRPALVWKPGSLNVKWDRTVVAVAEGRLTVNAPLTTALERRYGGGTVAKYTWPGRIENVGVENLRCESAFAPTNPVDEEHAWVAISLDAVSDAWVRNVTAMHFVSSAVDVRSHAKSISVQDCQSLAPVSELAGYRRHSFHTAGQLTLFLRCRAEDGLRDFVAGYLAAGPNVFLDCDAVNAHGFSGSIGSWASGLLFDQVRIDGGTLELDHKENWNQDVGWAAANSVIWQSTASEMICRAPPGAQNWAVAVWSKYRGNGRWTALNDFVEPDSLYRAQLTARRGQDAGEALKPFRWTTSAAVVPAIEQAIPDLALRLKPAARPPGKALEVTNGWLVAEAQLLHGTQFETPTWMGHLLEGRADMRGAALTRFAPGKSGPGWTDDLEEVASTMVAKNQIAIRHHWGLWYDERRNDHQMIRRADGDVWPPFFEQPWARSGTGKTWNGVTKYDLTRFNPWYFQRLQDFAEISRQQGRVLINEMYFQHNILEAGAHWADFPWRPANALQATGFPEPPEYVGGKRQFMASTFYDVSHPVRRELHRAYIRQCLANLAGRPNVIHTTGNEYTGPLSFVQFWLDVVAEWSAETGQKPLLAISATKDVQDAILEDPKRGPMISVIDFTYWWRTDEALYAPKGGEDLSPRQQERLWKGGRPTPVSVARMVSDYRAKYPGRAVVSSLEEADGWAFVAAGGSLPKLPAQTDPELLAELPRMRPIALSVARDTVEQWALANGEDGFFVYTGGKPIVLPLPAAGTFEWRTIDLQTGRIAGRRLETPTDRATRKPSPSTGQPAAYWVARVTPLLSSSP